MYFTAILHDKHSISNCSSLTVSSCQVGKNYFVTMFIAFWHLLGLIKNRYILFDILIDKSQVDYKLVKDGVPIRYKVSKGNINIVNTHFTQAPALGKGLHRGLGVITQLNFNNRLWHKGPSKDLLLVCEVSESLLLSVSSS